MLGAPRLELVHRHFQQLVGRIMIRRYELPRCGACHRAAPRADPVGSNPPYGLMH
jgi:hypothetical protein